MLQVRGLKKNYKIKGKETFKALDGVDLDFPSKGFVFILGKSGSGKSTLLNILGGLDKYDDGEIIIKEKSSKKFSKADFDSYRNTYLGFVFQEFNLIEGYTIEKNIRLALELQSFKGDMNAKVKQILEQVGLYDKRKNKVNEISGGQKQRIAIARALVKEPEIIIADEPTGALDSETGSAIMETLSKLSKEKLVIMVTHDVDYAAMYADRIIELKDGKVIRDETKEFRQHDEIAEVDTENSIRSVLRIPKGKYVGNEIIDKINKVINENNNEDLFVALSFDRKTIENVEKKTKDLPVSDPSKVEMINLDYSTNGKFKLIKSRLPIFDSLKMAFGNIWKRKARLIFTLILMSLAIFLFGMSETARTFNFGDSASASLKEVNTNYIQVYKTDQWGYERRYFNSTEFEAFKIKNGGKYDATYDLNCMITGYMPHCVDATGTGFSLKDRQFLMKDDKDITSLLVVNDLNVYGLTLAKGTMPRANSNDVLISDFAEASLKEILGVTDLIGHELVGGYIVSGVVSSNYKTFESKYESLKNQSYERMTSSDKLSLAKWEARRIVLQMFYSTNSNAIDFSTYAKTGYLPEEAKIYLEGYSQYTVSTTKNYSAITFLGSKTSIGKNEVVLSEYQLGFIGKNTSTIAPGQMVQIDGSQYEVVGYYRSSSSYLFNNAFVLAAEDFAKYQNKYMSIKGVQDQFAAVLILSSSQAQNAMVLNKIRNNNRVLFTESTVSMINNIGNAFEEMSVVFFYMSIVMLSLATFLLFSSISGSVLNKKKEIGTLRAIGARGSDVAKIFIFESLFIAIIVSTIAMFATMYVSGLFNNQFTQAFGMSLQLFTVGLVVIGEIYAVGIGISILAAFIPARRVSSMRPIDAIRNK